MPNRRACRIAAYTTGDVSETDQHDTYIEWFITTGSAFRAAVGPCAPLVVAALAE